MAKARKEKKLSPGEEKLQAIEKGREAEKPPEPRKPLRLVQELQKLTIRPKGGGLCKLVFDRDHILQRRLVAKFVKHFKLAEREYNKWVAGGMVGPRLWKPVRFIVLKRRQLGSTTLCNGIIYVLTKYYKETAGELVAHLDKTAKRQWRIIKRFYQHDKERLQLEGDKPTKDGIQYDENWGSEAYASTSGGENLGHGETTHFNVWTEFARWKKPADALDGLAHVVPKQRETWLSVIIIESTAAGSGNLYHQMWKEAVAKKSNYVAIFLGWKDDPLCRAELAPDEVFELDERESEFAETYGLDLEQMKWARDTRINDCGDNWDKFNEQYPISPEVAFSFTGFPVFDGAKIQKQIDAAPEPIFQGDIIIKQDTEEFEPELKKQFNGPLTIFELPKTGAEYSLGGDTADGRRQDFTVFKVIRTDTDDVVATWRSNTVYPTNAGIKASLLGTFYNFAFAIIERTPSGNTVLSVLEHGLQFDEIRGIPKVPPYPNLYYETITNKKTAEVTTVLGFTTAANSKKHIIGKLSEAIGEQILTENSLTTLIQMQGFQNDPDAIGKKKWVQTSLDAQTNLPNDDDIMALAIAYHGRCTSARNKYFDSGVELVA